MGGIMRIFALVLGMVLWTAGFAQGAAIAAADQAGGYGDQVLEKVARYWAPPADPVNRKVRVRISIDHEGKLVRCEPVGSSASAAMDKAACGAVREAGSFGPPPYGLPIVVAMSFWTGKPGGHEPEAAPAPAAVPVPPAPAKAEAEASTPGAIAKVEVPKAAPAKEAPKAAPVKEAPKVAPVKEAPKTAASKETHKAPALKEPAKSESGDAQYVDSVMAKISPNVVLPGKLPDGKYTVIAMVRVDARGVITQVSLHRSSGNGDLDSAIMRAVTKTAKVTPPPNKGTKDLSLTFVVQKP